MVEEAGRCTEQHSGLVRNDPIRREVGAGFRLHREVDSPAERALRGIRTIRWHHYLRQGQPDVIHVPWHRDKPHAVRNRVVHEVQSGTTSESRSNTGMVLAHPASGSSRRPCLRPSPGVLRPHNDARTHCPVASIWLNSQDSGHRGNPRWRIPRANQDGPNLRRNLRRHSYCIHRRARR